MKTSTYLFSFIVLFTGCRISNPDEAQAQGNAMPECEWCGAGEAPEDLDWTTTIAGPDEPGEPLAITGTVYRSDGKTPASGVILYAYHTNAEGIYPRLGDETGNAQRHGYLRSWMRTDAQGRYAFTTIRPGAYPGGTERAHIHMTVKEPGKEEYWIDDIVFEDDPHLTQRDRAGTGVVRLTRENGIWQGRRDIILRP